jgi:hypothetical protein
METNPPPKVTLGQALDTMKAILDGLNGKERLEALKALGGMYGHRVLPGTGLGPQSGPAGQIQVGQLPKGKMNQPKSTKSPEEKQVDIQIKLLNEEIKKESKEAGIRLKDDHPLLQRRGHLFRAKREGKGPQVVPQSGTA